MKKLASMVLAAIALASVGACEKSAKEEAGEAVKEMKRGDVKQAVEESGEAVGKAVKEVTH